MEKTKAKILILGVTASGKGKIAFELAKKINAEIISVDSMKVYRRMDIGTAKPPKQAQNQIKYHLIDVVEPFQSFSVGEFLRHADKAIEKIQSQNKNIIAVGGTALYIKALLYGLFEGPKADENLRKKLKKEQNITHLYEKLLKIDKKSAQKIHPNDEKRIIRALEVNILTGKTISELQKQWAQPEKNDWCVIGLRREKQIENSRINARTKKMLQYGLLDEVTSLLAEDEPLSKQAASAIGYAEIIEHLQGKSTLEQAVEKIKINTRRFAKHQRTWFKTYRNINWLNIETENTPEQIFDKAIKLLQNKT